MRMKTKPYKHQRKVFNLSKDKEAFALFMEQGTGKSKVVLDTSAHLYGKGKIELLIIVAPNGVHTNWIKNEIPTHLPIQDDLYRASQWGLSMLKRDKLHYERTMHPDFPGLRIIAVNIEAFSQARALSVFLGLVNSYDTLIALDESTKIKNPKAKRSKNLIKIGKSATYKRTLTGTPVTQGPLDLFSQFMFMDLPICDISSFVAYKHTFADWEKKINRKTQRIYEELQNYKNLELLKKEIKPHSFRVLKSECLDLPPKIYERRYVTLTKEQEKLYNTLSDELLIEIEEQEITTPLVLTKILRLQQIIGGFIGTDEGETLIIPGKNPRMEALCEIVEETQGKIIIWSRFRAEIALLEKSLRELYGSKSVVSYHGGVSKKDRPENVRRFQEDDECLFFIGQQHSAGYGLTLTAANTVIYYSNDFSLEARLQSEDRPHRIGQKKPVTYIDLETVNTIDAEIVAALRDKKNVANMITGDKVRTWL